MSSTDGARVSDAYVYAALRIAFGGLGCMFVAGLSNTGMFWDPAGLVPVATGGWKAAVVASGWGETVGRTLFLTNVAVFALMAVGYRTPLAVLASFLASSAQASWNPLPLSAAFEVLRAVLFCLIWADCGRVWSMDAALRVRAAVEGRPQPVAPEASPWPLRLIRIQVAVIYLATGLWKLGSDQWRDGAAIHYVLSNNGFARFPEAPPAELATLLTLATYVILLWELTFPALVAISITRGAVLWAGVMFHLGLWVTTELGPFPWVMLASYISFVPPHRLVRLASRLSATSGRRRQDGELKSPAGQRIEPTQPTETLIS
jgi:hypothetical protein